MEQDEPRCRPKVRRFTAPRREAFLAFLGKTGNWTAAAAAVGIDRSTADQRRKRDAAFAIACADALAEADRALAGAESAFGAGGQGEFNVIKRGRGGRTQIVRAGAKRWSRAVEERFFAALAICGNVAAAARAVGFTENCIWTRRRTWPAFRDRMEEMLDDAESRIEHRLAATGSDIGAAARDPEDGDRTGTATGSCPPPETERFDPEQGYRFLKWRAEKRRGGAPRHDRPRKEATKEDVIAAIQKSLGVLRKRKLAAGWSEDEKGCLIPPGWVRIEDAGDGSGDSAGNGDAGNGIGDGAGNGGNGDSYQ